MHPGVEVVRVREGRRRSARHEQCREQTGGDREKQPKAVKNKEMKEKNTKKRKKEKVCPEKEIKKLRSIAGGDTFVIIYLKYQDELFQLRQIELLNKVYV